VELAKIAEDPDRVMKRWELISNMEQELFGIGATCVEDKLQSNVPETIAALLQASNLFEVYVIFRY